MKKEKGFVITDILPEIRDHNIHVKDIEEERRKLDESIATKICAYLVSQDTKKEYLIEKEKTLIGRQEDCDIELPGGKLGSTISRHHAVLTYEQGSYFIEDISSSGTYLVEIIDGKVKVSKLGEKESPKKVKLENNSMIKFATSLFRFTIPEEK